MKQKVLSPYLMGCSEIEIHYKRPQCYQDMVYISCAEDANTFLRKHINLQQLDFIECFWVILMTNASRVLAISEVAKGTTLGVQPNPKYIFQLALLTGASRLIIAHNHPSGNLNISDADVRETKKMQRIAKLMDLTLLDHLIITSEAFVSFAQQHQI